MGYEEACNGSKDKPQKLGRAINVKGDDTMKDYIAVKEILEERKRAVLKSNVLAVEYTGNKTVAKAMKDIIEYIPSSMGDTFDAEYEEQANSRTKKSLREDMIYILGTPYDAREIAINRQVNFKIKGDYEIMSMEMGLDTINPSQNKHAILGVLVELYIVHNNMEQIEDLSLLSIGLRFNNGDWKNGIVQTGMYRMCMFGNDGVEKVLNKKIRLYDRMIKDWEECKNVCNFAIWDEKDKLLTSKS